MFRFQKFSVAHSRSTMKVGTDGVLLGAWADTHSALNILDIGTGCGLIALMAAQRTPDAHVTAIDIDQASIDEATENFQASPFTERLEALRADIQTFSTQENTILYDCILSNPPFFTESLLSPNPTRAAARSVAGGLSFQTLIESAVRILRPGGSLQIILPFQEAPRILGIAIGAGLHLLRRTDITTKATKPPRRTLLHWTNVPSSTPILHDQLCLTDANGNRSKDYQTLTKEFYL